MKNVVALAAIFASLMVGGRTGRSANSADVRQTAQGSDETIKITRKAECRWTDIPPSLDGILDDACWKNARPIVHFASYWKKKEQTGTTAYLAWDKDSLYYAGVMEDNELKAFGNKRNDSLWNGDVFELFFRPQAAMLGHYEFQANPKGIVFEAIFPLRNSTNGDYSKEPVLGSKAVVKLIGTLDRPGDRDISWTVEGRIPWSAFADGGGRPNPGAVWRFALCRYDYGLNGTEPILISSAPLSEAKFDLYEDYGSLEFIGSR